MAYALNPGAGFRRFDGAAARAAALAEEFCGLPDRYGPSHALAAFKRAASYMGVPASVVQLVDVMFAWTKPEDWKAGAMPIVWPRNDKLARTLGLKVRQVQNLLDRAIALGLISHRDSPNGHRGGVRAADGTIKWAYGIVLSPIGMRLDEFREIAERGAREDEQIDALKRRLSAARRRISSLAQAAEDAALVRTGADEELALALSATRQMRNVRDLTLLTGCVEQIETRGRVLEAVIAELLAEHRPSQTSVIAPSHEVQCTHSTTTNKLLTDKSVTSRSLADKSSRDRGASLPSSRIVENDMDKHGIDPDFIESVLPDLCDSLRFGRRGWGDVIHLAERLADQHDIHRHAWHQACRLMGQRGAAASVIATVHKYRTGEVQRPGAYLRGMSARAERGELHLGPTFHGLKDARHSASMRAMQAGGDPRSIGDIARRLVLSGRTS